MRPSIHKSDTLRRLTILDKLLIVPLVAFVGVFMFGAFILELFGFTMKPRKAAGYK